MLCARVHLKKRVNVHGWVYTNTLSSMCKDTCVCVRECDTYRQTTCWLKIEAFNVHACIVQINTLVHTCIHAYILAMKLLVTILLTIAMASTRCWAAPRICTKHAKFLLTFSVTISKQHTTTATRNSWCAWRPFSLALPLALQLSRAFTLSVSHLQKLRAGREREKITRPLSLRMCACTRLGHKEVERTTQKARICLAGVSLSSHSTKRYPWVTFSE